LGSFHDWKTNEFLPEDWTAGDEAAEGRIDIFLSDHDLGTQRGGPMMSPRSVSKIRQPRNGRKWPALVHYLGKLLLFHSPPTGR
jgi:hypothetical protein